MQVTTKAIVLSALKYGDTSLIVKAFTQSSGVKSYLLKGVLTAKKGKLKSGYFQPLTQLEIVAVHKNKNTLERLVEVKPIYHYISLQTEIVKSAMSMFLAEMLSHSLYEDEENEALFEFIEVALQWLDTHSEIANFHLFFLLTLTQYLGIQPDTSGMHKMYFDLTEGAFTDSVSLNPMLMGEKLEGLKMLLGTNFDKVATVKLSKVNRQGLLQSIILYFELHLPGFKKPKSLAVLNEVFS